MCVPAAAGAHAPGGEEAKIEPLPASAVTKKNKTDADTIAQWHSLGCQKINEGKVALVIMAGGMGTRLGSDLPKGMYNIGLPSQKSIF